MGPWLLPAYLVKNCIFVLYYIGLFPGRKERASFPKTSHVFIIYFRFFLLVCFVFCFVLFFVFCFLIEGNDAINQFIISFLSKLQTQVVGVSLIWLLGFLVCQIFQKGHGQLLENKSFHVSSLVTTKAMNCPKETNKVSSPASLKYL